MTLDEQWQDPPREFSVLPFWFWNDELSADELLGQIAAFERNGVYGFVIHPRVGLPRDCGWMSDKLLGFYRLAIEEAARRDMKVLLYDEGMYPSGSASGQLVAKHPDLACRCLALHDGEGELPADAKIVSTFNDAEGIARRVVDRPVHAVVRGLHYIGEGPGEDEPPAGDLLNPRTAPAIIALVYERFHKEFGAYFGKTILGIFTDEPSPLGRCKERKVFAGTTGVLPELSRLLAYDVEQRLAELWQESPAADQFRKAYRHAIRMRMEETWYAPLSAWCEQHGIALCGHPDAGDEIGVQRYFQMPGQDLVWRWVAPDSPTALEGPESTQGKCSASAMVHHGRRRNSNEFAGAYGAETTFEEVRWLANWCLVRGVNLLIPHAFYYSVRGPRKDERPPQLGLHTPQWDDMGPNGFKAFADHCRRWSWLNTDSRPIVDVAILTHDDRCPWPAAKVLLTHQRDFHYLDPETLLAKGTTDGDRLRVGDCVYSAIVIDGPVALTHEVIDRLSPLIKAGRVVRSAADAGDDGIRVAATDEHLLAALDRSAPPLVRALTPTPMLRVRIIEKDGATLLMLVNESCKAAIETILVIEAENGRRFAGSTPGASKHDPLSLRLSLKPNAAEIVRLEQA